MGRTTHGSIKVSGNFLDDVLPAEVQVNDKVRLKAYEIADPKHQTFRKNTVSGGYKLICSSKSRSTGSCWTHQPSIREV